MPQRNYQTKIDGFFYLFQDLKEDTLRKCEKTPNAKTSNLVITPKQGSAILFFNHVVSPRTGWMSEMVPQSLYGMETDDLNWTKNCSV